MPRRSLESAAGGASVRSPSAAAAALSARAAAEAQARLGRKGAAAQRAKSAVRAPPAAAGAGVHVAQINLSQSLPRRTYPNADGSAIAAASSSAAGSSAAPARAASNGDLSARRPASSAAASRIPPPPLTNLSGSNLTVLPINGSRGSHSRLPPSSAAAAASHARAGSSPVVAAVSLMINSGAPHARSASSRTSPVIAEVSLMSGNSVSGSRTWSGPATSSGGSPMQHFGSRTLEPSSAVSSSSTDSDLPRMSASPPTLNASSYSDLQRQADEERARQAYLARERRAKLAQRVEHDLAPALAPMDAAEAAAALKRASASPPARTASPLSSSDGTPIIAVSLSSAPSSDVAASAAASATASARRAKHHHRRGSSNADEEDDPSMPIEERHARAVSWLLRCLSRREEPLYCPGWFTAVDAAAMVGLAEVRHCYLELVHAFSLRAQALAYIDDVHEAWGEDKTRARTRSKLNMARILQRKPPLPNTGIAQSRRPSFSELPAVKRAASEARAANEPVMLKSPPPNTLSPPGANAHSATASPASPAPAPKPIAAVVQSAHSLLASFESLLSGAASPSATPSMAAAVRALEPPIQLEHTRSEVLPAEPVAQEPSAPPKSAPSALQQLKGATALLLGSAASGGGLTLSSAPADTPDSGSSPTEQQPSPSAVPTVSDDASDEDRLVASLHALLSTCPLLIKHSTRARAGAGGAAAAPHSAPKLSQLRLLDGKLYYSWRTDRPAADNRKFVRLREIVDVRPGLSLHVARKSTDAASFSSSVPAAELDAFCFHIVSLPLSAREAAAAAAFKGSPLQLPVFDELNLQTESRERRELWLQGLRILAARARKEEALVASLKQLQRKPT